MKKLKFVGSSLDALKAMPESARAALGRELMVIQYGGEPKDFKPMSNIGAGVQEIRYKDKSGAYRVIYIAKFIDAIYVLHAFQKKTQKTSKADLHLATTRYKLLRS